MSELSGILSGSGITLSGPAGAILTSLSGSNVSDAGTPIDTWNSLYENVCNMISEVQAIDWSNAQMPEAAAEAAEAAEEAPEGGLLPAIAGLGGGPSVAASLGNATSLGRLSVPPAWTGAAPTVTAPAATPLPAVGAAESGGPGSMLGGVPLAGGAGGRASNSGIGDPRYGFRLSVMSRPPAAG
jgi:PPE-repeat protein